MWWLAALWLWNGGTMSEQQQKPSIVGPALVPVAPVIEPTEFRTITDVEADITITRQLVAIERAKYTRAWPSRIIENLCDERSDYVTELNWLLEEWAALSRQGAL